MMLLFIIKIMFKMTMMKSKCDPIFTTKIIINLPLNILIVSSILVAGFLASQQAEASPSAPQSRTTGTILIEQQPAQQFSSAQLLLPIAQTSQHDNHHHNHLHHPRSTLSNSNSNNNINSNNQQIGAAHFQPSFVYGARNRSINFTHLAYDELTNSIYVGATNWLFQLSGSNLRPEIALKTGPASENRGDCSPADCAVHLDSVDLAHLPIHHAHGPDLSVPLHFGHAHQQQQYSRHRYGNSSNTVLMASHRSKDFIGSSSRTSSGNGQDNNMPTSSTTTTTTTTSTTQNQQQQTHNNYNKILAIDYESRQLIACGSLNQGACRRHQLGQLGNFSELIPLPVATNEEQFSTVALIVQSSAAAAASASSSSSSFNSFTTSNNIRRSQGSTSASSGQLNIPTAPIMYVAATKPPHGRYRDLVPSISARWLAPKSRAMQIIEPSSIDSARIEISFELRDYYLVNYVHAFQHQDHVYFATVQRKSASSQLEEWGYITRLARLCSSDLSFQSYAEINLECRAFSGRGLLQQQQQSTINYNLLQDAQLTQASSHLASQLGIRPQSAILIGVFSQSKDHTTKSQRKSAVCIYPMDKIEQTFNENIHSCLNGSSKARNMNYIAGSVSECPKAYGRPVNLANNICNEPIKLNGSIPIVANPIATYDTELLTSIASIQAPTSILNHQVSSSSSGDSRRISLALMQSNRQHQVLLAGTSDGELKRILLTSGGNSQSFDHSSQVKGVEFDSIQLADQAPSTTTASSSSSSSDPSIGIQDPILSDLLVLPNNEPQAQAQTQTQFAQFALVSTANKVIKLRVNGCRAASLSASLNVNRNQSNFGSSLTDQCQICSQLQDPFCGWCSSVNSCLTRNECIQQSQEQQSHSIHWQPFDQIRCADYQPVWPDSVPVQASNANQQPIEVNVRVERPTSIQATSEGQTEQTKAGSSLSSTALALQLSRAQFTCHFDYLTYANRSLSLAQTRVSGASTKSTQARWNLHSSTVSIGCPLPSQSQRPQMVDGQAEAKVRLLLRLEPPFMPEQFNANQLIRALGMRSQQHQHQTLLSSRKDTSSGSNADVDLVNYNEDPPTIERTITLYNCSAHSTCSSCLGYYSGLDEPRYSCAWCPLSNKCTFNASHPDFGCAASALIGPTTTPASASGNWLRGSHLTGSLYPSQASMFGLSIERPNKCPGMSSNEQEQALNVGSTNKLLSETIGSPKASGHQTRQQQQHNQQQQPQQEILIPNGSRRSVQLQLQATKMQLISKRHGNSQSPIRLECQFEIEMAKARVGAKLLEVSAHHQASMASTVSSLDLNGAPVTFVACNEIQFSYQEEIATQRAQVTVIMNDNQAIETFQVILYKCHLFGISPPALTSTLVGVTSSNSGANSQMVNNQNQQYSSAAWRAHEFLQLMGYNGNGGASNTWLNGNSKHIRNGANEGTSSDCSLCANIDRKYQCIWCQNQCQHRDSCLDGHQITIGSSGCPPPGIDSIHPTSGPLEGGTLITIEGSNLGSNEREIQDKISVGGVPCQLVMYSVSTRIVCKTGPSLKGPQAATLHVGNRAGITSAHEKFHYKPVHLTDVAPRIGPVSGGTRLYLMGLNLNVGSRTQIFLDDIPCALDTHEMSSQQISCITAPLVGSNMRITRLTLMIDNSTHHLPYPFTYQPDPIITNIEPAESFVSGGRRIAITGHHLASSQLVQLVVYHEHKHNILNSTICDTKSDSLIYCLTPAVPKDMINLASSNQHSQSMELDQLSLINKENSPGVGGQLNDLFSYSSGGFKMKLSLFMDDVRSVRNLDEYYHHLPHYVTYFDDPVLFRLPNQLTEYTEELVIGGENLGMKNLERDMLVYIGSRENQCTIKSIVANQIICEPPKKIMPVFDPTTGRPMDKVNLPIECLIGYHLKFLIGHMQYTSQHYMAPSSIPIHPQDPALVNHHRQLLETAGFMMNGQEGNRLPVTGESNSSRAGILIGLFVIGIIVGLIVILIIGLSRFRQSKSEREYKRIQLQMGSLDINGQPISAGLFDTIHVRSANRNVSNLGNGTGISKSGIAQGAQQMTSRALDYITGATNNGKNKLFFQISQPSSFPPSPLTDISSLTGSTNPIIHNQQLVKLTPNGSLANSVNLPSLPIGFSQQQQQQLQQQQQSIHHHQQSPYNSGQMHFGSSDSSSPQSSPSSSTRMNLNQKHQDQQRSQARVSSSSSRNFSWTQEAPSTVLPYAVIEACNLTLEGKNAIKEYV